MTSAGPAARSTALRTDCRTSSIERAAKYRSTAGAAGKGRSLNWKNSSYMGPSLETSRRSAQKGDEKAMWRILICMRSATALVGLYLAGQVKKFFTVSCAARAECVGCAAVDLAELAEWPTNLPFCRGVAGKSPHSKF